MSEPVSTDVRTAVDERAFSAFAGLRPSRDPTSLSARGLSKVPEITIYFWIIKVLTTGQGEATSDYLVHRMYPPFAVVLAGIALVAALVWQFRTPRYNVWAYWLAVVMVSVFGTMDADVLHIGLHIPYYISTIFFAIVLTIVFSAWYMSEKTLSIHSITTRRREMFYWAAVMTTFALGTAAGDMAAKTLGLGYLGAGLLFAALIAVPALCYWGFGLNAIVAFWFAYIVTRPLGASFADWMGVPKELGGLGWGRGIVAFGLTVIIVCFVAFLAVTKRDVKSERVTTDRNVETSELDYRV